MKKYIFSLFFVGLFAVAGVAIADVDEEVVAPSTPLEGDVVVDEEVIDIDETRLDEQDLHGYAVSDVVTAESRGLRAITSAGFKFDWDEPVGTSLEVEIRGRVGGVWSEWYEAEIDEDGRDGDSDLEVFSQLVFFDDADAVQYQVWSDAYRGDALPVIDGIELTLIDTGHVEMAVENGVVGYLNSLRDRFVGGVSASEAKPSMISRSQWGADESIRDWDPEYPASGKVSKVILHHTAGGQGGSDPAGVIRGIYYFHAVTRGWGDIGYNYLVDEKGRIYEGRYGGERVIAAHTRGYNTGSVGISVLGDYNSQTLTDASVNALSDLAAWVADENEFVPSATSGFNDKVTPNVAGHRDYASTACPGSNYYGRLDDVRARATSIYVALNDVSTSRIIAGSGSGRSVNVSGFTPLGLADATTNFAPYASNVNIGVYVAGGDVDGDGEDEIVTGTGLGGGPHLRVFERDGSPRALNFFPFHKDFRGGMTVATGDVDGDGTDEIAVAQAENGQAFVKVYRYDDARTIVGYANVFGSPEVGASVAMSDVDRDGKDELIVGAGPGGGPQIRIYDVGTVAVSGVGQGLTLKPISYFVFDKNNRSGVSVVGGDFDGDGKGDFAVAQRAGDEAWTKIYRYNSAKTVMAEFRAFPAGVESGAILGAGDVDQDGDDELLVGPDDNGGPQIRVFDENGSHIRSFFAGDSSFRGGVRPGVVEF